MLSNSQFTILLGRNREEATGSEEGEQREGGADAAAGAGQGGQGVLPAECGHHARDGAQHHQGRQGAQRRLHRGSIRGRRSGEDPEF